MTQTKALYDRIQTGAATTIIGNHDVLEQVVIAYLVGGHVLLEGVPGTAKTLLARTIAAMMDATFKRVQFTPDLLPSDIIGTNIFRPDMHDFTFRKGPVFTNVLLADEINRAPAKTQAALLEAMEERQVTVDGNRYPLGENFFVIATQNPIEYEGTYPLPEAEVDRFLMKVAIELLDFPGEVSLLQRVNNGFDAHVIKEVELSGTVTAQDIAGARTEITQVHVEQEILDYIAHICQATRTAPEVLRGASHRGSVGLLHAAKAKAALLDRNFVTPDDVRDVAPPILRHRLLRTAEAELHGVREDEVVVRIISRVAVPR